MDLTLTQFGGGTVCHMPEHSRGAQTGRGELIFWLLPIVVVVDTQVHCEHSHLSSHTYSSSQQIPALHGNC